MLTTTIHLVRHGQVENPGRVIYERLPGFHLSQRGHRMAQASAEYMAANRLMRESVALFSSPLERAVETAEHIQTVLAASGNRLEIQQDERLIEAANGFRGTRPGCGEGALWKHGNWRLLLNPMRPSWGESYQSIAERMSDFLYEQVDAQAGHSVIAVSHESPIWTLRTLLTTGQPQSNALRRGTALASVTSLTVEAGTHRVIALAYADPAAGVE